MTYHAPQHAFGVFIGRFQPFHNGHLAAIKSALEKVHCLIIGIGSANMPRDPKNPFTAAERRKMIEDALPDHQVVRLRFIELEDFRYNDTAWASQVTKKVAQYVFNGSVALIGHEKDSSSYYLKMFPQWEFIEVGSLLGGISATDLRDKYLRRAVRSDYAATLVPESTLRFLVKFASTPEFDALAEECIFLDKHRDMWASAPYPPTFITVDACVVQSGHVLLIQRRAAPGKGLWALPGGYLNQRETIEAGILRELREETRLKVPEPVLKGSIVTTKVFDAPDRSLRGRIVTHAALIHLRQHGEGLPPVKGADDAAKAVWTPISSVRRENMFEDHYSIAHSLLALL